MDYAAPIQTPEYLPLCLQRAGLGARFLAVAVDHALLALAAFGIKLVAVLVLAAHWGLGDDGGASFSGMVFLLLFMALQWGYFIAWEQWGQGASLGKRLAGIRVVMQSGRPVTFLASLTRNMLRVVDMFPFLDVMLTPAAVGAPLFGFGAVGSYGVALGVALGSRSGARLGDLFAATMVVRTRPRIAAVELAEPLRAPLSTLRYRDRIHPEKVPHETFLLVHEFLVQYPAMDRRIRAILATKLAKPLLDEMSWRGPLPNYRSFLTELVILRRGSLDRRR